MKKIILSVFSCLLVLLVATGCEESYDEEAARIDMIEYLNNKYNQSFEVEITEEFYCSGGIGICNYRGKAHLKDNPELKCVIDLNYEEFSDDCQKIIN